MARIAFLCAAAGAFGACSSPGGGGGDTATSPQALSEALPAVSAPEAEGVPEVEGEAPGVSELTLIWSPLDEGTRLGAGDSLEATVANTTGEAQRAAVYLTVSGLDGRLLTRRQGTVALKAHEQSTVRVPVAELPLQSASSTAFVSLSVELARTEGSVRLSTPPRYYLFDSRYEGATFWSEDGDLGAAQGLASRAASPEAVSGRIKDASGKWLDAAVPANREAVAPAAAPGGQGVTTMRAVTPAEVARATEAVATTLAPSVDGGAAVMAITNVSFNVCTNWRVQFVDAGLGTDEFNTAGWWDAPARYALATLTTSDGSVAYWAGQLNSYGCTPSVVVPAGTYQLTQYTGQVVAGGITFQNLRLFQGAEISTSLATNFTVSVGDPTTRYLYPSNSTTDIQTAALAGMVLRRQTSSTPLGMPSGGYVVHSNRNCPPDGTTSCVPAFPPYEVYISPTSLGGLPLAYWRFIVVHEIGHLAQRFASAKVAHSYGDVDATHSLCRCDHVSGDATQHCLQSREYSSAGQVEGFAQAFASRVFNTPSQSNATLVYYKEFKEPAGNVILPPVARNVFAPQLWLEQRCAAAAGTGVEWDWGIFFYRVASHHAADPVPFADIFDIYRRACAAGTPNVCDGADLDVQWDDLNQAALAKYGAGDLRYARFNSTLSFTGVDH